MCIHWERLGGGKMLATTNDFRFGTDAVLLTAFARARKAAETVCELGTGCGVIPFLLYGWNISPASVVAVDLQEDAIRLCERSKAENPPLPITFRVADWYDPKAIAPAGSFDTVICNPPYFAKGSGKVNESEARQIARHAKEDTLQAVCKAAAYLLKYGGRFCVCHKPEYLGELLFALQTAGLTPKKVQTAQKDSGSAPFLVLVEAVKGSKPGLQMPVPWVLDDKAVHHRLYGQYTVGE